MSGRGQNSQQRRMMSLGDNPHIEGNQISQLTSSPNRIAKEISEIQTTSLQL